MGERSRKSTVLHQMFMFIVCQAHKIEQEKIEEETGFFVGWRRAHDVRIRKAKTIYTRICGKCCAVAFFAYAVRAFSIGP